MLFLISHGEVMSHYIQTDTEDNEARRLVNRIICVQP